jgi:hypothetical protein
MREKSRKRVINFCNKPSFQSPSGWWEANLGSLKILKKNYPRNQKVHQVTKQIK